MVKALNGAPVSVQSMGQVDAVGHKHGHQECARQTGSNRGSVHGSTYIQAKHQFYFTECPFRKYYVNYRLKGGWFWEDGSQDVSEPEASGHWTVEVESPRN